MREKEWKELPGTSRVQSFIPASFADAYDEVELCKGGSFTAENPSQKPQDYCRKKGRAALSSTPQKLRFSKLFIQALQVTKDESVGTLGWKLCWEEDWLQTEIPTLGTLPSTLWTPKPLKVLNPKTLNP